METFSKINLTSGSMLFTFWQNLLVTVRFDVVPKPISPPKNIRLYNFTTVKIKGAFYIATITLTLGMNLNLNLKLADTIFGNSTVILNAKAEM